jgi:hypothetical protein
MRYSQLLPVVGAATALATPIELRKECAANDDSYDFVSADPVPNTTGVRLANLHRLS